MVGNGTDVFLAWEESYGSSHHIAFKQRSGGTWSTTTYFTHSTHVPTKPVIGIDNACGVVNLLWECGDHIARVSRAISGSGWNGVADLGPGRAPSIASADVAKTGATWTSGPVAPYSIKMADLTPCPDVTAPTAVTSLHVDMLASNGVNLMATASGDDGMSGIASYVSLRFSSAAINEGNWASAQLATPAPVPVSGGQVQSLPVSGLAPSHHYYFAVKFGDESGNWSTLSNVVQATTLAGDCCFGEVRASIARDGLTSAGGARGEGESPGTRGGPQTTSAAPVVSANALMVETVHGADGLDLRLVAVSKESVEGGSISGGGALYQTPDGSGSWETRAADPPPPGSRFVICAPEGPTRWVLLDPCVVDSLPSTVGTPDASWELAAASHSRLGDVTETIASAGSLPPLATGEALQLHYAPALASSGAASDWMVVMSRTAGGASQTRAKGRPPAESSQPRVEFALWQNQPNPFGVQTTFRFDLPVGAMVKLEVFDLSGRRVAIVSNAWMPAGQHSVDWARQDASGMPVRPGVYLYRLTGGASRAQRKLVVLP